MLRKALQAVIASLRHDLFRARIPGDGVAIVEHLVAGLDQQQIALRRDALGIEVPPFAQMSFRQFVRCPAVGVRLGTEVGAKFDVTRTWSPARASAASAATSASRSPRQRARAPRLANTAGASQDSPCV